MRAVVVVRGPQVRFGPLRLLERTDRQWTVIDERRKPGDQAVHVGPDRALAEKRAEELWIAEGRPEWETLH